MAIVESIKIIEKPPHPNSLPNCCSLFFMYGLPYDNSNTGPYGKPRWDEWVKLIQNPSGNSQYGSSYGNIACACVTTSSQLECEPALAAAGWIHLITFASCHNTITPAIASPLKLWFKHHGTKTLAPGTLQPLGPAASLLETKISNLLAELAQA